MFVKCSFFNSCQLGGRYDVCSSANHKLCKFFIQKKRESDQEKPTEAPMPKCNPPKEKTNITEEAKKLSKEHWEYIENVLRMEGLEDKELERAEFHYVTAFEHGFKHGVEFVEDKKS